MALCKNGNKYKDCVFLGQIHDYVEYKRACPWTNRLCHNPELDFLGRYIEEPIKRPMDSMGYFFYNKMMYNVVEYPPETKRKDMSCTNCAFSKICIDIQNEIPECSRANRKDGRDVYFVFAK